MKSKLKSLKDLYTALGGNSADVLHANSVIAVLNGILALGSVDGCQFVPDAIKAIADNLSSIDPSPAATLIEKSVTENGTYNASSDDADGYSKVTVNVAPDLTTKNITANGTYTATTDNADGYFSVTVNVPAPTPETYEVNITYDVTNAGGGAVTSSKTYSEILSAINAGKSITGTLTLRYEPQNSEIVTAITPIYGAYAGSYGAIDTPKEYPGIAFAIKPYYEDYLGEDYGLSLLVKYDNTWLTPNNNGYPTYGERLD